MPILLFDGAIDVTSVKVAPVSLYGPFPNLYAIIVFLIGGLPAPTTTLCIKPEYKTNNIAVANKTAMSTPIAISNMEVNSMILPV